MGLRLQQLPGWVLTAGMLAASTLVIITVGSPWTSSLAMYLISLVFVAFIGAVVARKRRVGETLSVVIGCTAALSLVVDLLSISWPWTMVAALLVPAAVYILVDRVRSGARPGSRNC